MKPLSAITRLTGSLNTTSRAMTKITVATAARCAAPAHVGGLLMRSSRRCWAVSFAGPLRSSAVGLRPVRPRVSILPAALPRCLVWRLRLVCAMGLHRAYGLFDRLAVAHVDVLGEAVERRSRRQADELRFGDLRVARDGGDDLRERYAAVVLDVQRDLRRTPACGELEADRADAWQARRTALADPGGDAHRVGLGRGRGELDVEGDQRRARRDERRSGGRVGRGWPEVGREPGVAHAARQSG